MFGRIVCALTVAVLVGFDVSSQQDPGSIRLDATGRADPRTPIAAPRFASAPGQEAMADDMASIVVGDLDFSGLFRIVSSRDYPRSFRGFSRDVNQLDLASWRTTPTEYLVYAYLYVEGTKIVAECRLFDVQTGTQVIGQRMSDESSLGYSRIAHKFADEIVRYLSGEPGIASSEIFFSAGVPGKKEIYVSDYDGRNVIQMTRHDSISIKPKVSPDGRYIAYLSYKDRYPWLYIFNRVTGESTPLSKKIGLNASPAWHPNGRTLALVLSKDGNTEIYLMDVSGDNLQRLTRNRYGDTSPHFSPDGNRIVFVSDRLGTPQLFVMDIDGSNERRLSTQGGRSYDPAWSPDGRYIAYVVERAGTGLEIYIMDSDGRNARQITDSAGGNESPSWSPDSRHIIFASSRRGRSELYTYTLDTNEVRMNRNVRMASEGPVWGPRRSS